MKGLLLSVILAAFCAAPSSGSQSSTPTPVGTAPPAGVRVVVGPGVPPAEEAHVRNATSLMAGYLHATFGSTREDAVINIVASKSSDPRPVTLLGGCCAAEGGGSVYLDVDDPVWAQADGATRMKFVAHEYAHTFQDGLGGAFGCVGKDADLPKRTPVWFYEGWAEYLAYQLMLRQGLFAEAAVTSVVRQAKADATVTNLRMISVPPLRGARGLYTLGFVAADRLTGIRGPIGMRDFCAAVGAGNPWQVEFRAAFDLNPDEFMDGFNAYVLALP